MQAMASLASFPWQHDIFSLPDSAVFMQQESIILPCIIFWQAEGWELGVSDFGAAGFALVCAAARMAVKTIKSTILIFMECPRDSRLSLTGELTRFCDAAHIEV